MKTLFIKQLYAICFSLLWLIIGSAVADIFVFSIPEFWEGYLIATGSYFGIDFYQAKHYKLIKRQREWP